MPNRKIVSFRSCVRARRGEAKLRERDMESVARARRGKVRRYRAAPPRRVKTVCAEVVRVVRVVRVVPLLSGLSRCCPAVVPLLLYLVLLAPGSASAHVFVVLIARLS